MENQINFNGKLDIQSQQKSENSPHRLDQRGKVIEGGRLSASPMASADKNTPSIIPQPKKIIKDKARKWMIGMIGGSSAAGAGLAGWLLS